MRDEFFGTMFINVHEIVHDSFLSSVKGINLVGIRVDGVVEFFLFTIFVNNWVILIFVSAFLKYLKCSVSLGRWRFLDAVRFRVVHKMLILLVNVC